MERMTFSVLWVRTVSPPCPASPPPGWPGLAASSCLRRSRAPAATGRSEIRGRPAALLQELTPQADVVSTRFTKALIKSAAALSYVEAQARMDDASLADPITQDLRRLNALAKQLRQQRAASGALTLASPEVKFTLDSETMDPMDVGMYQARPVSGFLFTLRV